MRGHQTLRDGAALYRAAADRSRTHSDRDRLLGCAEDLVQIAEWVEAGGNPVTLRELYRSSNGDRWHLARRGGQVFVRHEANEASGGCVSDLDVATFLAGEDSPQRQELLRLLESLIEPRP
jgi:hypothetical protein